MICPPQPIAMTSRCYCDRLASLQTIKYTEAGRQSSKLTNSEANLQHLRKFVNKYFVNSRAVQYRYFGCWIFD